MSNLEDRFVEKVDLDSLDGCWNWAAYVSPAGYGKFNLGRGAGVINAHRAAWLLFVGPLGAGTDVDHLCRNRRCVNPDHLEAVTHRENVLRGEAGAANLAKTHCSQGHPFAGANVYRYLWNGRAKRGCRVCRLARSRAGGVA